ncbi:MAG: cytochrome c oxidase subunit 3 [Panacagrimonas sp.]
MTASGTRADPELELPDFLSEVEPARAAPVQAKSSGIDRATVESGLWVFILGDMTLFGAFFVGFGWQAQSDPALFAASARELLIGIGGVNTLVLLTSSLFVVAAVRAMNAGEFRPAAQAIAAALACALVFAALKVTEYVAEVGAGYTPGTNLFFTYYFVLTGIHLLHVLIGAVLLFTAWRGLHAETPSVSPRFVEGAGIYWHMVDLLWVVLFPLLYISRLA